jgi:hypothetical protein
MDNPQNYNVPLVSPVGSTVMTNATTSVPVIGQNLHRRGIQFANGSPSTIYVCPDNQPAVRGQGIPIFSGSNLPLLGDGRLINYTCGWNAIADVGSGNALTVLELV